MVTRREMLTTVFDGVIAWLAFNIEKTTTLQAISSYCDASLQPVGTYGFFNASQATGFVVNRFGETYFLHPLIHSQPTPLLLCPAPENKEDQWCKISRLDACKFHLHCVSHGGREPLFQTVVTDRRSGKMIYRDPSLQADQTIPLDHPLILAFDSKVSQISL